MVKPMSLGGSFTFGNTSLAMNRMGYGAMQLAGPQVWGRRAIPRAPSKSCGRRFKRGESHRYERFLRSSCDQSQIIEQALRPYPPAPLVGLGVATDITVWRLSPG